MSTPRTAIARHHVEWLGLIDVSGPFLTLPVLQRALPHGLDPDEPELARAIRARLEELSDDASLQHRWVRWVLEGVLGFPADLLLESSAIPPSCRHLVPEHGESLVPDIVVAEPADAAAAPSPRLLVAIWPPEQNLAARAIASAWGASPRERMAELCRASGVPLGLVTSGRAWTLVHARRGESVGYATWDAPLWLDERLTLRAFRTLLGAERFFAVALEDTPEALLMESANAQQEVTDQLGLQVRHAVQLLVDALDRADRDVGGQLLAEVPNRRLYEAAVAVMMRLVFCFFAEEQGLLRLEDPLYADAYAASTLREHLQAEADRQSEDALDKRATAWHRLLALFRAIHGGVQHENLRLPAYGGGLFDPDRFPFLEGRPEGTRWRETPARPIPISDRTVLHILDALQLLRLPGRRGGPAEAQRLSYRSLDVEQIGHVYEGLLDHDAVRTDNAALGLDGKLEPEISLTEIEDRRATEDDEAFVAWLAEQSGRTNKKVATALDAEPDPQHRARLRAACGNDDALLERVLPYHGLLRTDLRGNHVVYLPGAVYVTHARERRSSGTYYTPRALAEEVVRYALDPLAYRPGPAEDADRERWLLRPAGELLSLRVCDMAMGSGAFLVAACRYLSVRLLEAWDAFGEGTWTVQGQSATGAPGEQLVPADKQDRDVLARRLIADCCLFGVDRNAMAVDMAKLSLWLITLARDRPFSFLDHALREGDSLLGVTSLEQVRDLHLDPERGRRLHARLTGWTERMGPALERALELRRELESFPARDVRDAERKAALNTEAAAAVADVRLLADVVVGAAFMHGVGESVDIALGSVERDVRALLGHESTHDGRAVARRRLSAASREWLETPTPVGARRALHWPIEFPEVFAGGGFDAIVGNPPFQGGKKITGALGHAYRDYLVEWVATATRGTRRPCCVLLPARRAARSATAAWPDCSRRTHRTGRHTRGGARPAERTGLDDCAGGREPAVAWRCEPRGGTGVATARRMASGCGSG